jgi:transcriptional regulator with XRE-family HTH domain
MQNTLLQKCGEVRLDKREQFHEAIKEAIGDLSISQVSYKTGISYEWTRKIIQLDQVPSEAILEKLAKGLDYDLEKLLVAAGYKQPTDTVTAVEYALNGAEDLSPLAKEQLMQMVREFAEKHKKE